MSSSISVVCGLNHLLILWNKPSKPDQTGCLPLATGTGTLGLKRSNPLSMVPMFSLKCLFWSYFLSVIQLYYNSHRESIPQRNKMALSSTIREWIHVSFAYTYVENCHIIYESKIFATHSSIIHFNLCLSLIFPFFCCYLKLSLLHGNNFSAPLLNYFV